MKTAKEFLEDWLDEDVTHRQKSMIGLTYYDVIEVMEAYKNQEQTLLSDSVVNNGLTEIELTERERLLELQRSTTRWFSPQEFNRLKELSAKMNETK